MSRILRSPRWWFGHLLVVTICILFVNLGFWQVRRLEERRIENTVLKNRLAAAPVPIEELMAGAGSDIDSLEFRGAEATGIFQPGDELLVRSQVHEGTAGWHVITPLLLADGRAVLVNRGWVPLVMDTVPVPAAPPVGEVDVTGWVRLTRIRGSVGPVEPEGRLSQISRVDLDRLQEQMPFPLLPVYLVADPAGEALPIAVIPPDANDQGPHLTYAIEWFSFTLIGVVGYSFLLKREVQRSRVAAGEGDPGEPLDNGDVAESAQ